MLNMLNDLGNVSVPEQGQSFKMTVRLIKKGFIFSCKITSLKEENRMMWNFLLEHSHYLQYYNNYKYKRHYLQTQRTNYTV